MPDKRIALTKDVILRAARQIKPELLLDPPEPEVYILDGKKLVVVAIPPNHRTVYQASGVFWVRRGTYTVPLAISEVMEHAHDRGLVSWEKETVREATMRDIDLELVKEYLEAVRKGQRSHFALLRFYWLLRPIHKSIRTKTHTAYCRKSLTSQSNSSMAFGLTSLFVQPLSQRAGGSSQSSRLKNLERVLRGMGCAKVASDGQVKPTNAGILFFGRDPQEYILQSEVLCVLFRDELGVGGYTDRKIVKGTLQRLVDETEAFLNKYVAVGAKIVGWKRIDLPEYPIEALREAVVNAIVHRDYSREGESVRLFYYSDRVEIHSPGLLLPGITVGQMQRGEVTSKLRNPSLATLLRDIPGYMERIGSGVRFMLDETRRMGLPPPQFREATEFVVTFRKAPVSSERHSNATSLKGNEPQQLTLDALPEVTSSPSSHHPPRILDQGIRIAMAMRYIHERGSILNREYRELTGVSEQTALRDLEALVEQGMLKRIGKTRSRQYKLP